MKTLERRLTEALRMEAEQLPDEGAVHVLAPVESKGPGFLRPGLAAPAAVVAVLMLALPVIWLTSEWGGGGGSAVTPPTSQPVTTEASQPVATTPPNIVPGDQLGSLIDQLPDGFDLEQASPVFSMDGGVEDTALTYLETRHLPVGVGISRVEEQDGYTLVQWAWGRILDEAEVEEGGSGWLVMSRTDGGYEILAATTDGIDLSQISITDGGFLMGGVVSDADDFLGVDVLNLDETPVASAPNPEGMPDADYLWGTAASGTSPVGIAVQISEPAILRVNRVGGTLLSISEVIIGQGITEESAAEAQELREPADGDWVELPGGLSVALVEESNGHSRIWTRSAVQGPTPAASTDIAFMPVPVSATEIAVLIPNPEFFVIAGVGEADPQADQTTAADQPATARVHWFEGSNAIDIVTVDLDRRFQVRRRAGGGP